MGRVVSWAFVLLMGLAGAGFLYAAGEARAARDTLAEARAAAARLEEQGLGWSALTPRQQDIVLAVEDPRFFRHPGLDPITPGVGPTTITQDLADVLAPGEAPPGLSELRRAILAFEIHRAIPKPAQLTLFLNTAGMGAKDGRWLTGYDAAARAYFEAPVTGLSDAQFINLAARPLNPSFYSRLDGTAPLAARVRRITRLAAGACAPASPQDVEYPACGP